MCNFQLGGFTFTTVTGPLPNTTVEWEEHPAVIIHATNEMYFHFLFDDLLGIYYTMFLQDTAGKVYSLCFFLSCCSSRKLS